jgi:hypothetical protein
MPDDHIVEEIHHIREQMLAECGGDFKKYMDRIRVVQDQDRSRLITVDDYFRQNPESKKK